MTPARPRGPLQPAVILPFAVVTLIWGSTWLVIRDQIALVPPGWSIAYRFLIAAAAMFLLAGFRRDPLWIGRAGLAFAVVLGTLQFTLNFGFVYRAEMYLTSGIVAVFYALLLLPNSLLAWIAYREPVGRGFLFGSAIAVCGVALLFLHEYRTARVVSDHVLTGILFCLLGLLCASVANVMQGARFARRLPMLPVLAWAMLIGAAVDALFAWAMAGPPVVDLRWTYVAGTLYLALAGSVVTFPLYFGLIRRIGPGRAAYTGVMIPAIAMLLSTLFEGYAWSTLAMAGAALSFIGMVVALRGRAS